MRFKTIVYHFTLLAAIGLAQQQPPPTTATYGGNGGMIGFISLSTGSTPPQFSSGQSFYATAWQMLERPIDNFQSGLAGTWIKPNNLDFNQPLCGKGTMAGDNWPERGPTYRDVFQTLEGGLGWWGSLQNRTAQPKFSINTTTNCYTGYVSAVGWGFGATRVLSCDKMGLVILSNRVLYPPDMLTLRAGTTGQLFGYAWMALPFIAPRLNENAPTGENSWTLFLNTRNFKGPLAFLTPSVYSDLSRQFPSIIGRGLDARPASTGDIAMEINTVPRYYAAAPDGTIYQRVPRIKMPAVVNGRSVLAQDITKYSSAALFEPMKAWMEGKGPMPSGEFAAPGRFTPAQCNGSAPGLRSEPENNATLQLSGILQPVSGFAGCSYGLRWVPGSGFTEGEFPEYYRKDRAANNSFVMTPVKASEVPASLRLAEQSFPERQGAGAPFTVAASMKGCWASPGPAAGPFVARLNDGSEVTYFWYRFVDQPALQRLNLTAEEKANLQSKVEAIHAGWPIDGKYMADPSPGSPELAAIDDNAIVAPPAGFENGYVPVITAQRRPPAGGVRESAPRVAAAGSVVKIAAEIVSPSDATARIGGQLLKIVSLSLREAQVLIPEGIAPGQVELVLYNGAREITFPIEIRQVSPVVDGLKSTVEITDASGETKTVSGNCVPVAECEPLTIPALDSGATLRLKLRGTGFRNADPTTLKARVGWTEYQVQSVAAIDDNGLDEAVLSIDKLPAGYGVVDAALLLPDAAVDPSASTPLTLPGSGPKGLRIDLARAFTVGKAGSWYFVDPPSRTVRRVSAAGEVTNLYTATADIANGMAVDSQERIYIVTTGRVVRVSADGQRTETLYSGGGLSPWGIALDEANGFLYCTNGNRVSRIDLARGTLEHIAGTGTAGAGVEGVVATQSPIQFAFGVAVSPDGSTVLYSDANDRKIRSIDMKSRIVTTVAGNGTAGNSPDGTVATAATISNPQGVAFDADGAVLFTQLSPSLVRRVDADGKLQTPIGQGGGLISIAVDSLGYLFAMDIGRNEVVRMPPSRAAKTVVAAP